MTLGITSSLVLAVYVPALTFSRMRFVILTPLQHSYAAGGLGGKNGAIVVDLYSLATMGTSGDGAVADITTGFRLGTIARNLWDQRRALPHGTCPYVGWGGHVGKWPCSYSSAKGVLKVELGLNSYWGIRIYLEALGYGSR